MRYRVPALHSVTSKNHTTGHIGLNQKNPPFQRTQEDAWRDGSGHRFHSQLPRQHMAIPPAAKQIRENHAAARVAEQQALMKDGADFCKDSCANVTTQHRSERRGMAERDGNPKAIPFPFSASRPYPC